MLVAFYKAKEGTLLAKLISLIDGSEHSHAVIVLDYNKNGLSLIKDCHVFYNGVSTRSVVLRKEDWDFINIPDPLVPDYQSKILINSNRKYGLLKTITTKIKWFPTFDKTTDTCSSWIARISSFEDPNTYGLKKLYKKKKKLTAWQ